ncbi:MAG: hypothetical protein ACLSFT_04010 [Ruminococcus callidus]
MGSSTGSGSASAGGSGTETCGFFAGVFGFASASPSVITELSDLSRSSPYSAAAPIIWAWLV